MSLPAARRAFCAHRMLACALLTTATLLGFALALRIDAPLGAWTRVGVGVALGQVALLWLPFGLAAAFDLGAAAAGEGATCILALGCLLAGLRLRRQPQLVTRFFAQLVAAAAVPANRVLLALGGGLLGLLGFLCHTHYLVPRQDGLHSAGVTWGDLPIHVALATRFAYADGLAQLEHPLAADAPLSYPFLPDHSVAVLTALGLPLRWAFILGGMLPLAALVVLLHGIARLWLGTSSARASALSIGLFFFAGGLGFVFILGRLAAGASPLELLASTNATYLDPYVLKSASIGNLFIAARGAAYGMSIGACAVLLLGHAVTHERSDRSSWLCAGAAIGGLPLVHAHSFIVACGVAAVYACLVRRRLGHALGCAGCIALFALPQLGWLWAQAGPSAVRVTFGLLRPADGLGSWFRDVALDLGLWLGLLPLAWNLASARARKLSAPLLALLPLANVVTFTPAMYDNVKLLAWFDLAASVLLAGFLDQLLERDRASVWRARARATAVVGSVLGCTLSGLLAVVFELTNDARVVDHEDVAFADFVARHTNPDSLIATGASYHDPIAMFSGRRVVLASPAMLGTHGIDVVPRARDLVQLYAGGPAALEVIRRRAIDAVVVGSRERADLPVIDEHFLREHSRAVHERAGRTLYLLRPDRADHAGAEPRARFKRSREVPGEATHRLGSSSSRPLPDP